MTAGQPPAQTRWLAVVTIVLVVAGAAGIGYFQFVYLPAASEKIEVPPPRYKVNVTIVEGSVNPNNGQFFVSKDIVVVLGVNHTISWTNTDLGILHTVTSERGGFDFEETALPSNFIQPGTSWEFTFSKSGTYKYFCNPHPWMRGSIEVLPPEETGKAEEPKA